MPYLRHTSLPDKNDAEHESVVGGAEGAGLMCQRSAEIWAAEHVEIKAGEYPKIRCSRHEFGSRVG
jgi:hypothetical protein